MILGVREAQRLLALSLYNLGDAEGALHPGGGRLVRL